MYRGFSLPKQACVGKASWLVCGACLPSGTGCLCCALGRGAGAASSDCSVLNVHPPEPGVWENLLVPFSCCLPLSRLLFASLPKPGVSGCRA